MRFWPRSLLGQVLLAVAGALLLAQAISAVLLFRAAELTLANGYDYFVMADRDTQLRSRTYSTPGAFGPGFGGWGGGWWGPSWRYYGRGFGWRSWDPFWGDPFFGNNMDINTIDRYEATAEIVMRKGPIPRDNLRAFDARAIVNTIGPTVVLPK